MILCGFPVGLEHPFFLIAGPCVIESRQMAFDTAGKLQEITRELDIPFIYKSSFDKANRSSRSEEHTSVLQSRCHLVCRLLLEKKKYMRWQCRAGGPGRHDLGLVESLEGGLGCRLSNLPHWIRVV